MSSSHSPSPELFYRNKSLLHAAASYEAFGLQENPFSLTPDPRYLYRTRHAHETLRQLTRGIVARKGLILLSGEVGTGKTTLLNSALQVLRDNPGAGNKTRTAVLVHPTLTREEFVEAVLTDFQVPFEASRKSRRLQILSDMLLEVRRHSGVAVLAIDEAQLLSADVLEEIRNFANMRFGDDELLQIVLCGQPEIEGKFASSAFSTIQPLVTVRCVTSPLTLLDTREYIQHRMKVAGARSDSIFTAEAANSVHHHSQGIPRLVNLLCSHALAAAGAIGASHVTARMISEAADKLPFPDGKTPGSRPRMRPPTGTSSATPSSDIPAPTASGAKPRVPAAAVPRTMIPLPLPLRPIVARKRRLAGDWPDHVFVIWLQLSFRAVSYTLDRWWSIHFARRKYSLPLVNLALAGAILLVLAQGPGFSTTWEHTVRSVVGFSGLLLLDISLGLAGYLYLSRKLTPAQAQAPVKFFWAGYRRLSSLLRGSLS